MEALFSDNTTATTDRAGNELDAAGRARRQRLLSGLNTAQAAAVTSDAVLALRIIAGAGSGKTRVLTRRIARRVAEGEVDPAASARRHVHPQGCRRAAPAHRPSRPARRHQRRHVPRHRLHPAPATVGRAASTRQS
ncbi:MAG: UvrD-helicase domain-containing protein, partial [Microthrixaceae bacterium]